MRFLFVFFLLLFGSSTMALSAQDKEGKQKAKIKFRSRALLDGAVPALPGENAKAYFRVEDLRLGANITYDKISATADVGFSGGEIAVKDIIFNYSFKNFVISAGNAFEPFSLEMLMSSADMMFNQSASSDAHTNIISSAGTSLTC